MASSWEEIAGAILDTIKERAGEFLKENAEVEGFLKERAARLAKLMLAYSTQTDQVQKQIILDSIGDVRQTIENDVAGLTLKGKTAAQNLFREIVNTAFGAVVKMLPALIPLFR